MKIDEIVAELKKERQRIDQALAAVLPLKSLRQTKAQADRVRQLLRMAAAMERRAQP